ncbi:glycosyltransferase family 4 protein [Saccharicrinis aurantiacus]|uniref:glycosyltransferase family 4 protein n=1 Tax=Saccharicrinis aurantiacus TaxID=1849719 RepID=UPI00249333E0|nr:glycosyltransferase family 4 protein [Saccharicrinis aurantiacus]
MKIVEIGTGYTQIPAKIGAATEIVIENLLNGLNNNGIEHTLIDISYSNQVKNSDKFELSLTHYVNVPNWLNKIKDNGIIHIIRRIWYSIGVGLLLRKLYRNKLQTETYIHFHNQFNFFFAYLIAGRRLRKGKIRTIYTVHSPDWSNSKKIPKKLFFEKIAILKADVIISLTNIIKDRIKESVKINSCKIIVINNGVDLNKYHPIIQGDKQKQIINIGSVCKRKNQLETIVNIKEFLLKENYKFVFAGKIIDHKYFNEIVSYIHSQSLSEHVKYIGEVKPGSELNKLYNKSMLYISHSKQEALSLVVLECMAANTPVVLSENFETFVDFDSKIRNAVKIISNHNLINEINNLCNNVSYHKQYALKQMEVIQEFYTWDNIAKLMIKKLAQFKQTL